MLFSRKGAGLCIYHHFWQVFSHKVGIIIILGNLRNSKSPEVFRTLLSILANLNSAVVVVGGDIDSSF